MKFVLVQPVYSTDADTSVNAQLPLGLLAVATVLANINQEVEIIDLQKNLNDRKIKKLDDEAFDAFAKLIIQKDPDVVGVSCMSVSYIFTMKLVDRIKLRNPCIKIFLGGPHPTLTASQTVNLLQSIDYVMIGESEMALPFFCKYLENDIPLFKVPNLAFRYNGRIVETERLPLIEQLDSLPYLRYDLIDELSYYTGSYGNNASIPIEAGRGCPYNCTFCSTSIVWMRKYRVKSPTRILSEVKRASEIFGAKKISFIHDNMAVNKKWLMEVAQRILEEFPELMWGISARVDNVDAELLSAISRAGCKQIYFGIEAGSEKTQKRINKNLKTDRIYETLTECRKCGIDATFSFIIGYPFEELTELEKTFKMAFELKAKGAANVQMHILTPEASTPLTKEYYNELIPPENWENNQGLVGADGETSSFICKNKDIFTNFYHFPLQTHSYNELVQIHDIAWRCLFLFPKTMHLLSKDKSLSPLRQIEDIIGNLNDNIDDAIISYLNNKITTEMCLIDRKVKLIFDYEKFQSEAKLKPQRIRYSDNNIYAAKFPYQIIELKKSIELDVPFDEADGDELVISVSTPNFETVKRYIGVSKLKFEIVSLLINDESLQEAYRKIKLRYGLGDNFIKTFKRTLLELVNMDVLRSDCVNEL